MYPRKLAKSTKNARCNLLKQQLDRGKNCWYYNARAFVSTVSSFITTIVKEAVVPMIYTVTLNPALDKTVEIPNHPFYIGVQFHPEFKSRPNRAHPLFKAFVAASLKRSQNNNAD